MRADLLRYGVKKFVALVHTCTTGATFMVFTTGDDRYYLFDCMNGYGLSWGMQTAVLKADLARPIRSALYNGWGNSLDFRSGCRNRRACAPVPAWNGA